MTCAIGEFVVHAEAKLTELRVNQLQRKLVSYDHVSTSITTEKSLGRLIQMKVVRASSIF